MARRKGFWKPYVSGALGGLVGAGVGLASGGISGAIQGGRSGASGAYNAHESIRKKYNVPWLGKRRKMRKTPKRKSRKRR